MQKYFAMWCWPGLTCRLFKVSPFLIFLLLLSHICLQFAFFTLPVNQILLVLHRSGPNEYTLHLKGRKVVWPATGPKQQHQQQQQQQLQQQQQSGKTFQVCALPIFLNIINSLSLFTESFSFPENSFSMCASIIWSCQETHSSSNY